MKIHSFPTTYAGVRFRSRLEARWAAFFDLCGWRWTYEPFELEGWAPDFALGEKQNVLVEVKPLDQLEVFDWKRPELAKAVRHAPEDYDDSAKRIAILGLGPFKNTSFNTPSLGVFLYRDFVDEISFGYAGIDKSDPLDISETNGSYRGALFGRYDGNPHMTYPEHGYDLWNHAGTKTQWRGR